MEDEPYIKKDRHVNKNGKSKKWCDAFSEYCGKSLIQGLGGYIRNTCNMTEEIYYKINPKTEKKVKRKKVKWLASKEIAELLDISEGYIIDTKFWYSFKKTYIDNQSYREKISEFLELKVR